MILKAPGDSFILKTNKKKLLENYLNYISVIKLGKKLKLPIVSVILFFLPFFNTYKCKMFSKSLV